MLPSMIGVLNRFLSIAGAKLVRTSRWKRLESDLAAQRSRIAELESSLCTRARDRFDEIKTLPGTSWNSEPSEEWRRDLLMAVAGIVDARLTDASLMGYHEASRTTAAYILKNMRTARLFRSPFICTRGDFAARDELLLYALSKAKTPGLMLEFGVFSGESINLIARAISPAPVYGFDSFEGLPEDWFFELRRGYFDRKGQLPAVGPNVELVPGWFHETLPPFLAAHPGPASFVHIDCDLYTSTAAVFHSLRDRIVPGTVILFDEYFNYPGWEDGEFKAFAEFMQESRLSYEYLGYTTQWFSAAVLIKNKPTAI